MRAIRTGDPPNRKRRPGQEAASRKQSSDAQQDTTLSALRLANFSRLRREHQVEQICRHGPRLVAELIEGLVRYALVDEAELDARLAKFAAADPVALAITDSDRMVPAPVHSVVAL
jgi:hypothetical protein